MRKILPIGFIHALMGAALISVVGCAQTGGDDTPDPTSLREVQIPEDFTFATSRGVALTVTADENTLGAPSAALEVARNDGRVLYRGPIAAGSPMTLNLAVPSKDDTLKVKIMTDAREHNADVTIADNGASHAF